MTDIATLAQQAIAVIGPLLPLAASYAAGPAVEGFFHEPGAKLYDWLTKRIKGTPAEATLDRAVAEPQNQRRLTALQLEIEDLVERDAEFKKQLAGILAEIAAATGGIVATQTSTQIGNNNKSIQIAGSHNSVQS
jgi:hypothetical protein